MANERSQRAEHTHLGQSPSEASCTVQQLERPGDQLPKAAFCWVAEQRPGGARWHHGQFVKATDAASGRLQSFTTGVWAGGGARRREALGQHSS